MPKELTVDVADTMPGLPLPLCRDGVPEVDPLENVWTLTFRQGQNPRTQTKNFRFAGSLREAIERFRLYCEKTNRTFIVVTPFLSQFEIEEKKHLET